MCHVAGADIPRQAGLRSRARGARGMAHRRDKKRGPRDRRSFAAAQRLVSRRPLREVSGTRSDANDFIAPSLPFQGDQAVDAHAARAPAHHY